MFGIFKVTECQVKVIVENYSHDLAQNILSEGVQRPYTIVTEDLVWEWCLEISFPQGQNVGTRESCNMVRKPIGHRGNIIMHCRLSV